MTVFGSDHFEERFAHLLDFWWGCSDNHTVISSGRTRCDWITNAHYFYNAEAARSEGIESIIVAESWDFFSETAGDLIDGFAFGESGLLTINGDGELRGNGGVWVVDHVLRCERDLP